MPYTNGVRFTELPGIDNRYVVPSRRFIQLAYASTISLVPQHEEVKVFFNRLTGNMTITSNVNTPYVGDKLILFFQSDASPRTVTFSTGFITNATVVVAASKEANIEFTFSDKSQSWVETSRFIQS
jgi:hypothetical protein